MYDTVSELYNTFLDEYFMNAMIYKKKKRRAGL